MKMIILDWILLWVKGYKSLRELENIGWIGHHIKQPSHFKSCLWWHWSLMFQSSDLQRWRDTWRYKRPNALLMGIKIGAVILESNLEGFHQIKYMGTLELNNSSLMYIFQRNSHKAPQGATCKNVHHNSWYRKATWETKPGQVDK